MRWGGTVPRWPKNIPNIFRASCCWKSHRLGTQRRRLAAVFVIAAIVITPTNASSLQCQTIRKSTHRQWDQSGGLPDCCDADCLLGLISNVCVSESATLEIELRAQRDFLTEFTPWEHYTEVAQKWQDQKVRKGRWGVVPCSAHWRCIW